MSTAMPCLDLHVCMHVLCSYAYVHVSHMLVCLGLCSPMPLCYIYMLRYISICLHAHFHACMCRSVCLHVSISVLYHALCHHLCACMLQAMFMCLTLDLVCHVRCYCSPFVSLLHFLAFWPNGLGPDLGPMVFVIVHTPRPTSRVWIIPICMSMLACFYALCLC